MKNLPKSFFNRSTLVIAQSLLGCYLIHKSKQGTTIGKIIETEAYLHDDPASHSFPGKTKRNSAMFGPPGHAYIYFTYGMYHCFNVTTNNPGVGEAVLIRAIEPISGIKLMKKRRNVKEINKLCNGPGKLAIAMSITPSLYGADLRKGRLTIKMPEKKEKFKIVKKKRIGISK